MSLAVKADTLTSQESDLRAYHSPTASWSIKLGRAPKNAQMSERVWATYIDVGHVQTVLFR